jgi:O-antigen ligase
MPPYTRFPPKGTTVPEAAPTPEQAAAPVASTRKAAQVHEKSLNWLVPLLMWSLVLPVILNLGPLRLSPNRLILVLTVVPLVVMWLSGFAGRIRTADILVILSSLWIALTLIVYGGTPLIETAGITGIEMLGPYLMARCFIRTEAQYASLIRTLYWIALVLAPIAAVEAMTGIRLLGRLFDPFFVTFPYGSNIRWGMIRAQTGFEHPILFGCFTAFLFSPIYFQLRARMSPVKAFALALPVPIATFFALSMGAYLGLLIQFMLIGWAFMTRKVQARWQIIAGLTLFAYVFVDVMSNRTPFEVFISYLTFDAHTAYWRVLIFTFGMENVWGHPIFGLGLGDWERPYFMYTSSVDNFWLLMAMRHGIPGFLLIAGSYVAVMTALMRAKPLQTSVQVHRKALVFSLIGLGVAIITVHLWTASFVFFMFMLGAGAWMSEGPQEVRDKKTARPAPGVRAVSPRHAAPRAATSPATSDRTRHTAARRTSTRP